MTRPVAEHACPLHGPMVPRPATHYTPEQRFCGDWWDCERCSSSVLIPSPALLAQLDELRSRAAQRRLPA